MIIVHIVEAFGGGVYTYLKSLSNHFSQDSEVKNIIIYSSNRKEIDINRIKDDFLGIEMIQVNMQRNISLTNDFKSIINLRKLLKKLSPDVVHLHSSKAGVLGRLASFGIIRSRNIFYSPHGYSFLSLEFSSLKRKLFYCIEKYFQFFLGGTTIACGDTEYKIAKKIGKSVLVRNGILPEKLEKYKKNFNNAKLTIGILGRITTARNPILFNKIASRFPEINFVWIGDGELKHLLTSSNIKITGWSLDSDITFNHLNSIDIYIQTSLWEGLPLAVLEAMALNKPVVATNVIGNKDIVEDEVTGYLFEDIQELDYIIQELKQENKRLLMGKFGYERCSLLFNSKTNFNQLKAVYLDSIVNNKR